MEKNTENTERSISPKTYRFKRFFGLFRPSETQKFFRLPTMVADIEHLLFQNLWILYVNICSAS